MRSRVESSQFRRKGARESERLSFCAEPCLVVPRLRVRGKKGAIGHSGWQEIHVRTQWVARNPRWGADLVQISAAARLFRQGIASGRKILRRRLSPLPIGRETLHPNKIPRRGLRMYSAYAHGGIGVVKTSGKMGRKVPVYLGWSATGEYVMWYIRA